MICEKCKKVIPDDSAFCPYCGEYFIGKREKERNEAVDDQPSIIWFFFGVFLFVFALCIAFLMSSNRPNTAAMITKGAYCTIPIFLIIAFISSMVF